MAAKMTNLPKGLKVLDDSGVIGKLYQTEIVNLTGKSLTLRNGGWLTPHTKKCINLILAHYGLGLKLTSVRGQWIVSNFEGRSLPFRDGMVISL